MRKINANDRREAASFIRSRLCECELDAYDSDGQVSPEALGHMPHLLSELAQALDLAERPSPMDDDFEFPDGAIDEFAQMLTDLLWAKSQMEGAPPGSPLMPDIWNAMSWYVAYTEARQMRESYNAWEWASSVQGGMPPITVAYVEDWIEHQIEIWFEDFEHELDSPEAEQMRIDFWEDFSIDLHKFHGMHVAP